MVNIIKKFLNLFSEKKEIVKVNNEEKNDFDKLMEEGMSFLKETEKYFEDKNYNKIYLLNDKAIKVFEEAQRMTNEEDMKKTIQRFINETKEKNNMMLTAMALEK
jgi:hypothetical protein